MNDKPKVLWVGDAGCPSGFALSTHQILDTVKETYDVTVLGINYRGDPHPYDYPIYAAMMGGDPMGFGRIVWMCDIVKPDVIVLQNDPWNIPGYLSALAAKDSTYDGSYSNIPVVAIMAVDGKNMYRHDSLNKLSMAIFWTQFAVDEMKSRGLECPMTVLPLGVDLNIFKPMDKYEARQAMKLPKELDDAFIVGNVNRNQPRKRLDLTIRYFAEFVHTGRLKDAYLYLHVAPTGDTGISIKQLAAYYGVLKQLVMCEPPVWYGVPEEQLRIAYNCFDVQINTGQGEGFGLTTLEGMACGVPQIVGDWSGLGCWAKDTAVMIPCTSTAVGPPYINVIGGVPDEKRFVMALNDMWTNLDGIRDRTRAKGLEFVQQERFRWKHIGEGMTLLLNHTLRIKKEQEEEKAKKEEAVA